MTTPDPDAYWRRPVAQPPDTGTGDAPQAPVYAGPPRGTPPPPGWRIPLVAEPHPPRELPPQDHAALDAAEREARTFTYRMGLLAGAILLILMVVMCARVVG